MNSHLNFLPLITNDVDSIRRVDSDSLDERQDRQVVDASSDFPPSCSSLDRDSRLMDPDGCKLESKELLLNKFLKPSVSPLS
jgi:hypothetical protein